MPKAMGGHVKSGGMAKVMATPNMKTKGAVGPMARGATSRVGNSTMPPSKSGSSTVKGGRSAGSMRHPSGGKKMRGAQSGY